MQALDGFENEFEYSLVGHSGNGPEAERCALDCPCLQNIWGGESP